MVASTAATLITQPVDVIRTRLQLRPPPPLSPAGSAVAGAAAPPAWTTGTVVVKSLVELVQREGAAAMFTGGVTRVLKRSLSTAVTWTLFEGAMRSSPSSAG